MFLTTLSPHQFLMQHEKALLLITGTTEVPLDKIGERFVLMTKAHPHFQSTSLIQWLSEQLALPFTEEMVSQKTLLNTFIEQITARKRKFLLIIENAQELPFSTLAALSHLAMQQEEKRNIVMPIFLMGKSSLIEKIQSLYGKEIYRVEPVETDSIKTILDATNEPFFKRHAVKMISIATLFVMAFGLHFFKNHPLHKMPRSLTATKPLPFSNNVIALGPDVLLRETRSDTKPPLYTLQLTASLNYKNAARYIALHHLNTTAEIHLKKVKGANWFVVNYGRYPSPKAASQAKEKLPASVKKDHPWVQKITT